MFDAGPERGITTLAIATADEVFYAGGTFGGVPVSSGDVLVMYTYAGDLNMDGLVDGADYGVIDNFVQFPGISGYSNGDFNYDGLIDGADYGVIDNTVQLQGDPFPAGTFGASGGMARTIAVPEPAACGAALLAVGLLARRQRRRDRYSSAV
jgi:MYXO-CTERM domain-containing protein